MAAVCRLSFIRTYGVRVLFWDLHQFLQMALASLDLRPFSLIVLSLVAAPRRVL
jgi:hypothetical protein